MRSFDGVRVGDDLPEVPRRITRDDVRAYADASGDQNPLHQDVEVARAAGFPDTIAHGMFTMGHLVSALLSWAGSEDALSRIHVQFRAPAIVGETIVAGGTVTSRDAALRSVTLDVWVRVERDGEVVWPIRRSEAEVRLA
jgi:acyl dehydratase